MLIDSHLHLSKSDYDNIEEIILRAKSNGVNYLIVSCCSTDDIEEGLDLIKKYDNVFLAVGLHPSEVKTYNMEDINKIKQIAKNNKKIVAIGEIGLDYYYEKDTADIQKELFIRQLNLAQELNLPVVIHTRDATEDTINILKNYILKGVVHCFSGSLETLKIYAKMGYKIGIGGVSTFKNSNLKNILKEVDLTHLLLETDSPYLSPEPMRGTKNEPSNLKYICENLASIKQIEYNEVANTTSQNTIDLFDLNRFL